MCGCKKIADWINKGVKLEKTGGSENSLVFFKHLFSYLNLGQNVSLVQFDLLTLYQVCYSRDEFRLHYPNLPEDCAFIKQL